MKILYLLRHAEAAPDHGEGDFERNLTPKGFGDALVLGQVMQAQGYNPQLALCSSARRTSQTLERLSESLPVPDIRYDRAVYHAARPELFSMIADTDNRCEAMLVVGHNPTIHELALWLAKESTPLFSRMMQGYPPGTLSVLHCPCEHWQNLQPAQNTLRDLLVAE